MDKIKKKAYKKIKKKSNVTSKKYLLDALAKPNLTSKDKQDILKLACQYDRDDIVEEVSADDTVDLNAEDENGQTPLFLTVRHGSADCFNLLLGKDVDLETFDKNGRSVLTYAVDNSYFHIVDKLMERISNHELLEHAVSHAIQVKNSEGLAILAEYKEIGLEGFEGKTGFFDKRQYTALHYASKRGFKMAASKLIASGNRTTSRNKMFSFNWLIHKSSTSETKTGSEIQELLELLRTQQDYWAECGDNIYLICVNVREHLDLIDVFQLPCVEHMTFINCNLGHVPCFPSLTRLALISCSIDTLEDLSSLKALEVLTISDSDLTTLPDSLKDCQNLRCLNINNNRNFRHLPTWVMSLPLELLAINDNNLTDLPELLPKSLRVLLMQNNRVKKLSPLLARSSKLSHICLHGNPLVFPELSIAKSKTKDLLSYLKAFLSNTVSNNTVKISLVGQERVGKSTLLQALKSATGNCEEIAGTILKTDGLEISTVSVKDLNFRIFDLAGDIDFMETHSMFISEGTLFLAVFDLRMYSLNTLNSHAFGRIEVWLSSIYAQAPNSRVMLVGTHADGEMITSSLLESTWQSIKTILLSARRKHQHNFENNQVNQCLLCSESPMTRKSTDGVAGYVIIEDDQAPRSRGKSRAASSVSIETIISNDEDGDGDDIVFPHIVGYFEVSSVKRIPRKVFSSKNTSIDQLKDCIHAVSSDLLSQNPYIPRKWTDLHSFLAKKVEKHFPIISYQEFTELARECGFDQSNDELNPFLRHYNSCGELLYYFDIDELCDVIIIDPQWLSNQLRAVISFRATHLVNDGVIEHTQLEGAWHAIEARFRGKVLSLFRQAGIFIRFTDTADLIPCRLPVGRPSEDMWPQASHVSENQVDYCFKFNNLPPSFFSHLTSLVESKRDDFSVGKMAPLYYSNHIVYVTKSTGIPCDVHTDQNKSVNLTVANDNISSDVLVGGVKLARFLSLDAESVDSLLDAGRNSFRVSMTQFSDFGDLVVSDDRERKKHERHRVHFELLPHLKCITVSIRGPTPCCLAPETIDLLNRVSLTRYNAIRTEFYIVCPICIRKSMPKPSKFDLEDVKINDPICELGHDSNTWQNILTGVCDFVPVLTTHQIVSSLNDYECPKLFLMMPVNLHGVGFRDFYTLSYLKEGYSVHLLCEFPDCWHFLTSPGYRLSRPKDFVKKYGRRLQTLLRVLSKLEIPARVAGLVSETANNIADLFASLEKLATDLDEHLADFTEDWSNFNINNWSCDEDFRFLKSNDGMNRREFRRFLNKADEEQRFGDLIPTFVGGRVLWLCEKHHRQELCS